MNGTRIHKYLADSGVMSRRAAEEAIKRGEIKINGETAAIGQKVTAGIDVVEYKGREISSENPHVYIMLNKPVGYVTTMSDERGRPCVRQLVEDAGVRVYPVGRLDIDSEGLLLLTNDGELANRLTHPRHGIAKYYNVTVKGQITPETRKKLSSALDIDGYIIRPVKHTIVSMKPDRTTLRMELYEGRNRQIRKMCELCGLEVLKLRRVAIGNISVGNLKPGCWKYLTKSQSDYLMTACRMKDRRENKVKMEGKL